MATKINTGNVINQRGANPCKESDAQLRKHELDGSGFKSQCLQKFFFSSWNLHSSVLEQSSCCGISSLNTGEMYFLFACVHVADTNKSILRVKFFSA